MSQHIQHHPQQPQYVHYSAPSSQPHYMSNVTMMHQPMQPQHQSMHIMHYQQAPMVQQGMQLPQQPQLVPQQQQLPVQSPEATTSNGASVSAPAPASTSSNGPLVATGDWTKDLVQLAKQAELKKHALTLQLHTAHILSAHATLEQKSKAIQDVKEQKNKLDSERARLLRCLQEINADRDKADLAEGTMQRECDDLRAKITQLSEGEYAIAKNDVDRLRVQLGQQPLPSLQQTLEERTAQYLTERRLNGNELDHSTSTRSTPGPSSGAPKRSAPHDGSHDNQVKRPRGRPKGSKNKKQTST